MGRRYPGLTGTLVFMLFSGGLALRTESQCVDPPAGLVAWWPFDESGGSVAADLIGGIDATLVGSPAVTTGKVFRARRFIPTDHGEVPPDPSLDITGDITVVFWYTLNSRASLQQFVSKGGLSDGGGDIPSSYLVEYDPGTDQIVAGFETGTGTDETIAFFAPPDTDWHMIAYRRAGMNHTLFLDSSAVAGGGVASPPGSSAGYPLAIGGAYSGTSISDRFLDGSMDELQIYDRALMDSEIENLFVCQYVDLALSTATIGSSGHASIAPLADTATLASLGLAVTVTVLNPYGSPIEGIDPSRIELRSMVAGALGGCAGPGIASPSFDTDPVGQTTIGGALQGGGWTQAMLGVFIDGLLVTGSAPLDIEVNGPDLTGDGNVNLSDVQLFGTDYFTHVLPGAFRSDLYRDNVVDLVDWVTFARFMSDSCPAPKQEGVSR